MACNGSSKYVEDELGKKYPIMLVNGEWESRTINSYFRAVMLNGKFELRLSKNGNTEVLKGSYSHYNPNPELYVGIPGYTFEFRDDESNEKWYVGWTFEEKGTVTFESLRGSGFSTTLSRILPIR